MAKPNKLQPKTAQPTTPRVATPATPRTAVRKDTPSVFGKRNDQLVFGRENYKWMLIGIVIMAVGYLCMSGGSMPDANTWNPDIIYSPVRIILAPFLILLGLAVEVYAIFKKTA